MKCGRAWDTIDELGFCSRSVLPFAFVAIA